MTKFYIQINATNATVFTAYTYESMKETVHKLFTNNPEILSIKVLEDNGFLCWEVEREWYMKYKAERL